MSHPDFDTQNILVKDDGTLCGLIDWDGVAAVPACVGALRYPLFLARDWEPNFYNYDTKTRLPKNANGPRESSPEELDAHRAAYAQYIEGALLNITKDSSKSKKGATLTRASVALSNLENAANNPGTTEGVMMHTFEQLDRVFEELGLVEYSNTDSKSTGGSVVGDAGDSDSEELGSGDSDEDSDEESEDTDSSDEEAYMADKQISCPKCAADGAKAFTDAYHTSNMIGNTTHCDAINDGMEASGVTEHQTDLASQPPANNLASLTSAEVPTAKPEMPRKVRFARYLCAAGEQGCRSLINVLHRDNDSQPSLENSRANGSSKNIPGHASTATKKCDTAAILCASIGKKLRVVSEILHCREKSVAGNGYASKPWFEALTSWLSAILEKLLRKLHTNDTEGVNLIGDGNQKPSNSGFEAALTGTTPIKPAHTIAEVDLGTITVAPPALVHAKHCPRAGRYSGVDVNQPHPEKGEKGQIKFEDVWARIGLQLQNAGIPAAMLKVDQVVISEYIISSISSKMKVIRERDEAEEFQKQEEAKLEKERRKKARRAERKAKEAQKAVTGFEDDVKRLSYVMVEKSSTDDLDGPAQSARHGDPMASTLEVVKDETLEPAGISEQSGLSALISTPTDHSQTSGPAEASPTNDAEVDPYKETASIKEETCYELERKDACWDGMLLNMIRPTSQLEEDVSTHASPSTPTTDYAVSLLLNQPCQVSQKRVR